MSRATCSTHFWSALSTPSMRPGDWMLLLGRKTAQEKVAALLFTILRCTSLSCAECEPYLCHELILPLSRTEMGDYLGLRVETVSRQMKKLEILSIIERIDSRRICVRDAKALAEAAGPDLST